jgi:iron(III) transport system substrate-binding protein
VTYDVLVLGGGAAGCALAGRLSENPDRSVCLVEAGPDYGHFSEGRWPADILDPRWKGKISCKISASGLQFVQWYMLRKLYGDAFWKEFAKLQPHAFDSRVQLFDRLSKGDDNITAIGEYPAYILFKSRGAKVEFVAPPDGLVATPLVVGAVNKAPHPEASKLFVDWAMSKRGQAWYQTNPNLYYASVRTDAPPMPTGVSLTQFKLLYPTDWDEYSKQSVTFLKEWNGMLGL